MKKQTSMKKGITLIEIILAIVLIAIILGITIPKLMANSARAEIKAVISSDVKSIVEAAALWRKSYRGANGSFASVTNQAISSRLPTTMVLPLISGVIESSGLRTGSTDVAGQATGVNYIISWTFSPIVVPTAGTPGTPTMAFSLAMDTSNGVNLLNWDTRLQAYANEIFQNTMNELTVVGAGGNVNFQGATIATLTTGVKNAVPAAVTCGGNTNFQCSNLMLINQ